MPDKTTALYLLQTRPTILIIRSLPEHHSLLVDSSLTPILRHHEDAPELPHPRLLRGLGRLSAPGPSSGPSSTRANGYRGNTPHLVVFHHSHCNSRTDTGPCPCPHRHRSAHQRRDLPLRRHVLRQSPRGLPRYAPALMKTSPMLTYLERIHDPADFPRLLRDPGRRLRHRPARREPPRRLPLRLHLRLPGPKDQLRHRAPLPLQRPLQERQARLHRPLRDPLQPRPPGWRPGPRSGSSPGAGH